MLGKHSSSTSLQELQGLHRTFWGIQVGPAVVSRKAQARSNNTTKFYHEPLLFFIKNTTCSLDAKPPTSPHLHMPILHENTVTQTVTHIWALSIYVDAVKNATRPNAVKQAKHTCSRCTHVQGARTLSERTHAKNARSLAANCTHAYNARTLTVHE
jgi:hypothetical protein